MPTEQQAPRRLTTVRQCFAHSCRGPIGWDEDHRLWLHVDANGHIARTWTGHFAEPMAIKDLCLGDHFRFFNSSGTVYGPVASAESDYMLQGTNVRFCDGTALDRHAWTFVEVTRSAPLCACDRPFEHCENACPWPAELEELWSRSITSCATSTRSPAQRPGSHR